MSNVEDVVAKVRALRKLTRDTGCVTRRTQSIILASLSPQELTEAAEILAQQEASHAQA